MCGLCDKHITIPTKLYHLLMKIGRIRRMLSKEHTEMHVHAVFTSRLENCNSLLINTSKGNLYKLPKVQNAAAGLVVKGKKRTLIVSL